MVFGGYEEMVSLGESSLIVCSGFWCFYRHEKWKVRMKCVVKWFLCLYWRLARNGCLDVCQWLELGVVRLMFLRLCINHAVAQCGKHTSEEG